MRAAWGPPEGPGWTEGPAPGPGVWVTQRRDGPPGPDVTAPTARRRGSRRRQPEPRLRIAGPLLLLVVLAVQAVLSLRLVRADTAFDDEATSLWAGHLEWAHWLHGTSIPQFPKYFSGAPMIYPPLGALADSLGGLAAARVLSLLFMLGATVLLWATTGRLYGQRAALFAAALFAVLGPTLHLGAFATYDALPRGAGRAGRVVCGPGGGPAERNRVDGRRGHRTGGRQCRGIFVGPVRSGAACTCAADHVAVRAEAGGPAVRDLADHRGGAASGRGAHRRERLSRRG